MEMTSEQKFPPLYFLFPFLSHPSIHHSVINLPFDAAQLRSWFRHYATSWKVAGSIPDEVFGFLN
jgi:hypothetical protein